jgi:hypothetical protein
MALSDAGDAKIAFCRTVPHAPCQCSVETVETELTATEASELLVAMRRAGVVSAAEMQTFWRRRDAACDARFTSERLAPRQAPGRIAGDPAATCRA